MHSTFIIVVVSHVIPFMRGICYYMLEKNRVSRVYRAYIAVANLQLQLWHM